MDINDEDRGSDAAQGVNDSPTMEASPTVTFSSPPIDQRTGHQSQYSGGNSNGNASDRKRSRRAMTDDGALDDILGQITSKLTNLSTKENLTEEDSINAFVDVLNCARSEAQFFLESSNWNVETAVMLWLENNPTNSYSSSYQTGLPYAGGTYVEASYYNSKLPAGGGGASAFQRPRSQPRYRPRPVVIEGLPKEWTARVSKHTGQVYFIHVATGGAQYSVPTGFADLPGSGSPENAIDLSVSAKTKRRSGSEDNDEVNDEDEDMLDVSKDSDIEDPDTEIEPLSPVADPLGINMMQNSIAQAQYSYSHSSKSRAHSNSCARGSSGTGSSTAQSGTKSGARGNESAFRDAMDEYSNTSNSQGQGQGDGDANSVNSAQAVWDDEGSGYSLNDGPAYSVSSTTTNTNSSSVDGGSSVFGSMNNRNSFGSANNNNFNSSTNANLPYYAQNLNTQELAPTPTEGHLFSAHSSGIAMLTPSDASVNGDSNGSGGGGNGSGGNAGTNIDTGDYFLGSFTPGRESNGK